MTVPLAIAGQPPIGALLLAMTESRREFDEADLALARELGHRAAIAIENARLYAERSLIATTLQRSLLPPELPRIPGFRLAGFYQAAGEQNDVGGDFYDAFEVPGGWMVVVGDVAGRGAEAAALTSLSRYTLRTAGKLVGDPIAALEQLNAALREASRHCRWSACAAPSCAPRAVAPRPTWCWPGTRRCFTCATGPRSRSGCSRRSSAPTSGGTGRPSRSGSRPATSSSSTPTESSTRWACRSASGRSGWRRRSATSSSAADTVARIEQAVSRFAEGPQVDDTAVIVVERVDDG